MSSLRYMSLRNGTGIVAVRHWYWVQANSPFPLCRLTSGKKKMVSVSDHMTEKWRPKKNSFTPNYYLGSQGLNRHGRETGTTYIFHLGLMSK